jgi:hypothetical protein
VARRLSWAAVVVSVVLLPFSVLDWAALHDIWWDYASPHLVARFTAAGDAEAWPAWTRAEGEWAMVTTSLYARTALVLVHVGLAIARLRAER